MHQNWNQFIFQVNRVQDLQDAFSVLGRLFPSAWCHSCFYSRHKRGKDVEIMCSFSSKRSTKHKKWQTKEKQQEVQQLLEVSLETGGLNNFPTLLKVAFCGDKKNNFYK